MSLSGDWNYTARLKAMQRIIEVVGELQNHDDRVGAIAGAMAFLGMPVPDVEDYGWSPQDPGSEKIIVLSTRRDGD